MPTAKNSFVFFFMSLLYFQSKLYEHILKKALKYDSGEVLSLLAAKQNRQCTQTSRSCHMKDYAAEINHSASKLYSQL